MIKKNMVEDKITFIIQARLGSTRLPGKILLPFYNDKSILELMVKKLTIIENSEIVIATSIDTINNELEDFAKEKGVVCFRGSENDVLQRFIDAAEYKKANKLIRVCSDNPFLDLSAIKQLVEFARCNEDCDYISFDVCGKPSIKTHYGFWTEYVTLSALKKVVNSTDKQLYHEHVTNYIYEHPNSFNIKWINVSSVINSHPYIRLTIDTKEDFLTAQNVYSSLVKQSEYPTIEDIVNYLDANSTLYDMMKEQILKNSK